MKKLLTVIAAAIFAIYPSICFASYVIHLKDGTKFATDQYYEEGDQIKFKRYGGVIGIQKDLVREIEVIEDVEELPEEKAEAAKPKTPSAPEKTDNDLVDIEYYKREKQRLEQELDEAKQRYLSSLEKGDKETKHAASRDALKINKQIHQLKKDLKEKNKGVLPEWWNE